MEPDPWGGGQVLSHVCVELCPEGTYVAGGGRVSGHGAEWMVRQPLQSHPVSIEWAGELTPASPTVIAAAATTIAALRRKVIKCLPVIGASPPTVKCVEGTRASQPRVGSTKGNAEGCNLAQDRLRRSSRVPRGPTRLRRRRDLNPREV